ncbi:hypothetical protein A3844_01250 [Paenibacillus helianthi]|uniref:Uncharacterized protein n=1 Tax=Paenibacillus helianthi TaxID=1349432 RepID=A0ABX3EWM3_9BACL|nr:hypothetical protein A3844_01250 [Paenibacillus helianthi]
MVGKCGNEEINSSGDYSENMTDESLHRDDWVLLYLNLNLYAGSWSDWISYEENPEATGE